MDRKQTVANLMGRGEVSRGEVGGQYDPRLDLMKMKTDEAESRERLFEVVLIAEPQDCEIVDGRVVIRKQVIARSRIDAIARFGVEAR